VEFTAALGAIAAAGGYGPGDLRRFANPLLCDVFRAVFT
jgi:hypothetical protein